MCVVKNKSGEPCGRSVKACATVTVSAHQIRAFSGGSHVEDPAQCLQDLIFKLPSNTAYNL